LGARRGWLEGFVLSMAGHGGNHWSMPHVSATHAGVAQRVIAWQGANVTYWDLGARALRNYGPFYRDELPRRYSFSGRRARYCVSQLHTYFLPGQSKLCAS